MMMQAQAPAILRTIEADAALPRKRVLFLTHRVPYPPDRGDRIRAFHILQFLARRYDVSLAAVSDEPVTAEQMQVIEGFAERVAVQRINPRWSKVRGLLSLAAGGAVTPSYFYRNALARTIESWHQATPFDAVITLCTGMIQYARHIPRPARQILDLVDVDSAKWNEYARHSKAPMRWIYAAEAKRLRDIEAGSRDQLDGIAVVSDAEAATYRAEVGNHVGLTTLRHAVDVDYHQPMMDAGARGSKTIVFIGVLNYKPNVEGIRWFVQNVMPALRQRVPDMKLQIIGRHPSPQVLELGNEANVEVVGSVPDVRPYLNDAIACIAPLQIARGVQTKVLEAMASSRVAVCSVGAAQGIHAEDDRHLLICKTPQQWAAALERVINDDTLRTRIAGEARRRIEEQYRWDKCYEPLENLIEGSASRAVPARRLAA